MTFIPPTWTYFRLIKGTEYKIGLHVVDGCIRFFRNDDWVSPRPLPFRKKLKVEIAWKPDEIRMVQVSDIPGVKPDVLSYKSEPAYVPQSLITWAKRLKLLPKKSYTSDDDLLVVVLESIRQTTQTIHDQNSYSAFWDYQKKGRTRGNPIPKFEKDAVRNFFALLDDQALAKSFEISLEPNAATGLLDVLIVAPLSAGGLARIAIEAKNAHSDAIEHGLVVQLPTYMRAKNAAYGIFLVLWYRCDVFNKPNISMNKLLSLLGAIKPTNEIIVEHVDLAFPLSPSDKKATIF